MAAGLTGCLVISIGEARKLLGKNAQSMSDDELTVEIWRLMEIASDLLKVSSTSVGE